MRECVFNAPETEPPKTHLRRREHRKFFRLLILQLCCCCCCCCCCISPPTTSPALQKLTGGRPATFWTSPTKKIFFQKIENFKKSKFSFISFSSVSTYFSILSSLSGRIRPHLALDTQKFRNNIHKQI